jgi:hypothetical protein
MEIKPKVNNLAALPYCEIMPIVFCSSNLKAGVFSFGRNGEKYQTSFGVRSSVLPLKCSINKLIGICLACLIFVILFLPQRLKLLSYQSVPQIKPIDHFLCCDG